MSGLSQRRNDKTLWIIISLSAVLLFPVLIAPPGFDDAIPHIAALDFLRLGRLPYIGFFDQSFPGIFFIHIFEIALLGGSDLALRVFDLILQLLFVAFLYHSVNLRVNRETAGLTSVLYICYYVGAGSEVFGQRDVYIAMLLLVSLSLLLPRDKEENPKLSSIWISGILTGIAITIRPTSLLFAGLFALFLLVDRSLHIQVRKLDRSLVFLASSLMPIGIFLVWYSQIPGGLEAFYIATIRFNLDVYTQLPSTSSFWRQMARFGFLIIFALLGMFSTKQGPTIRNIGFREKLLYIGLILSAFVIVLIQGKFFRDHFATFFILLVPIGSLGILNFLNKFHLRISARYWMIGVLCFLCTFVGLNDRNTLSFVRAVTQGQDITTTIYREARSDSSFGAIPEEKIIDFLHLPQNSNGSIEICSLDPNLRLHAGQVCVSRYPTLQHLAMKAPSGYTEYQLRWQSEYVHSLEIKKPRLIIVGWNMQFWAVPNFSYFLHSLPGFDSLLSVAYDWDTVMGGYTIYRLKNDRENDGQTTRSRVAPQFARSTAKM